MEYSKLKDEESKRSAQKRNDPVVLRKPPGAKAAPRAVPDVSVLKLNQNFALGGPGLDSRRTAKEHSFLTDVADVRQMEQGLLELLDDFHSGKLQAFGEECSYERMDQVREQQERLARLHFELDSQQELHGLESEEARKSANENLAKLVDNLHELSVSIHHLQKGQEGEAGESSKNPKT